MLFPKHKRMISFSLVLIFFFISSKGTAQCNTKNMAFKSGEIITYSASYNWGFIWVDAGRVSFKVLTDSLKGEEVFHFKSYGKSVEKYDWIYKVRDSFESWATKEALKPLKYIRKTSEDDFKVHNIFNFDYSTNKIYTETKNTNKKKTQDTLDLQKCTFDLITAVYYARNINFTQYKKGSKIPIKFIVDNEIFKLNIQYLGRETIKTKDNRVFKCLKFSSELVSGTIFDKDSDMVVWVSDDKNRVPVLVEAKVLVGYVKALLLSTKGLRHPLSAEVK